MQKLIDNYCQQLRQQGLKRERLLAPVANNVLNFSSNDYLALRKNKAVSQAFKRGFENYPSGSGGSMLVSGYHSIHQELEKSFSRSLKVDDAILFSSGYAANLGVVSLLAQMQGYLYIDKAVHASFYDGIQLNRASFQRFLHNNLSDLSKKLASGRAYPVVITEGVFSMTGQLAPLPSINHLCEEYGASLIVDEAHAFGVLGKTGLGAVSHYQLTQDQVAIRIIPLGKAMGGQGAVVAGRKTWIDALLQLARSYIYSTAISPAMAYGLLETFHMIQAAKEKREKLAQIIAYFNKALLSSPLKWRYSLSPIQQLQLSCPHKALFYAKQLLTKGIFCQPMREPTVKKADTGLRIVLNCDHEPSDIDYFFQQLHRIYASEC